MLALPDIVGLQVWEQGFSDRWRGVVVFVHKIHQVLRRVILLREPGYEKKIQDEPGHDKKHQTRRVTKEKHQTSWVTKTTTNHTTKTGLPGADWA